MAQRLRKRIFVPKLSSYHCRDIIADANILQGAIFCEDVGEYVEMQEGIQNEQVDAYTTQENPERPLHRGRNDSKMKKSRPAAHRVSSLIICLHAVWLLY